MNCERIAEVFTGYTRHDRMMGLCKQFKVVKRVNDPNGVPFSTTTYAVMENNHIVFQSMSRDSALEVYHSMVLGVAEASK